MTEQHRTAGSVVDEKVTAERENDFVVFHIGMRVNAFWKVHRWLPIVLVAPLMVRELVTDDESGLLGSRTVLGPGLRNIGFIQYWESFEALRVYARDTDRRHHPAWTEYYESGAKSDTAMGIWHETYLVDADDCETLYNNMPPHGLAACNDTTILPAENRRKTATGRLGLTNESEELEKSTESIDTDETA